MQNVFRSLILTAALWTLCLVSWGQVVEIPLEKTKQNSAAFRSGNTQILDTLNLPFWDDFSTSLLVPDSTKWLIGNNVNINRGRGLDAPTLNVATFDGTNQSGVPYSESDINGKADSLVSQPIDLSTIPTNLRSTLYLSFFWQKKGNSEIPESIDSLRLQFKDQNGKWNTVWSAQGGDTLYISSFKQEIIQIPPGSYQHSGFQFKFQSFGKLTGGYDNWHIDYVLLRTRRDAQDLYVRDRALSTYPTSIFKNFTAIPFEHYCKQSGFFQDSTSVTGFSLEPPVGFPSSIRFAAQIFNTESGALIDEMNNTNEDGLLFNGQQFTTIQANAIDTSALISAKTDSSLLITTKFFIRTKDSLMFDFVNPNTGDSVFFNNIDLTVNDTATSSIILDKHYAYDDGSAETAAGVNTANGQLAFLYVLPVQDTLTDVQIYFPNTESNQADQSLRLKIWSKLGQTEILTHTQTIFISASDSLDKFTTYPLSKALLVGDSLFIGIQQTGSVPIFIGLDKNNQFGNQIYFNTSGVWEANTRVQGSLMLRPVFGSTDDIITAIEEPQIEPLKLYPNPIEDPIVNISGPVAELVEVVVSDLSGRVIPSRFDKSQKVIEFSAGSRGIYVVRLSTPEKVYIQQLILR
ncbi:MAG: hypothetical protein DHS20C17_14550 [Cyclobacteriaceae bacterium]|nr:MAG: hypothetical protein DHS20C17_14550 [Cyclobacteriaceae bacterium]